MKNAGLPFILDVCACLCARAGYLDIAGHDGDLRRRRDGPLSPTEYDNNKLFYIWFMFAMILAADYGSLIMQRLARPAGAALLCGLFCGPACFPARCRWGRRRFRAISSFRQRGCATDSGNTNRDDVILTGQQHNPSARWRGGRLSAAACMCSFHGLDYPAIGGLPRRFKTRGKMPTC